MSGADPIIVTDGLSINFGGLRAVDTVSVSISRGGITSVIGPNGAGKSTFFNLLSGALRPSSGTVRFNGETVTGMGPEKLRARGLSRSFQITNLFRDMHVFDNLRLASQILEPASRGIAPATQSKHALARAEELIERFELVSKATEPVAYLSHGEQRRLEIAVALACRPQILLLDEPTQGMSHMDTMEVKSLIQSIGQEITVLLIEHDIDLVMDLSREVIVLNQGALLAQDAPDKVRADANVQAAYLGEH
jgi:branched-chain amino acid transport system ATP-binding protein